MNYEPGTLVSFRGRDWVVLPPRDASSLLLRPLGGLDAEIVQIFPRIEAVAPAAFAPPDPAQCGDARSCALLRDAVRLGLRTTTGPFRSFGHIAVEPRPYQLVPLLMALRQEVVRLLIADDVGIGKTVEALLIARELLDRGEIARLAVLCPPPLAEQWQKELAEKFHIAAELVLPSTVHRLERGLGPGESIFEKCPFTVVSLDFIKSGRYRLDFIRACPEMVIVDEAHACASPAGSRGRKQRYELVEELAKNPRRHMIFVTATPHSGKEDAFRSLLAFLKPEFADLATDLAERREERKKLAEHFIQRRRGDLDAYLDATPFPARRARELTWSASRQWSELFARAMSLARETVASGASGSLWQQRVSWWAALALLRAVSSSPAAAAQALASRAAGGDAEFGEDVAQLDIFGSRSVYDLDSGDETAILDTLPGVLAQGEKPGRHRSLAALANALAGAADPKLAQLIPHLRKLLADGFAPVVFCRFIATAEYLARELRQALPQCEVQAVTGLLAPEQREAAVRELAAREKRLLVCTDCLSEGINLQRHFDAVVHYDLSWNPTRHEQREGRVDRFGQASPEVRVITWWGADNPMDGMVLDVLLRKHESIRKSLGISVPVPEESDRIMETLLQGLLLRRPKSQDRPLLPGLADFVEPERARVALEWDNVARREAKRSRSLFAQQSIRTEEVARALAEANAAQGSQADVERFMTAAWELLGGVKREDGRGGRGFSFDAAARAKYAAAPLPDEGETFVFRQPASPGQVCLTRTHPHVEELAAWLAQTALDPEAAPLVARSGVMRTASVSRRTTLLLLRLRFLISTAGAAENTSLAEECAILGFTGSPQNAGWLEPEAIAPILAATPAENIASAQAAAWLAKVTDGLPDLAAHLAEYHQERARALLAAHRNVRSAAKLRNLRYAVKAQGSPDIIGIFVYLPLS